MQNTKNSYGAITLLTLKVGYTTSIFTFLFAVFCYFILDIKGFLFQTLLLYSVLNFINILLFNKHRKLAITYNIMSILAFIVSYTLCFITGGINSPFTFFLVTIVFTGFLTNSFYGKLWLIIISLSIFILFVL